MMGNVVAETITELLRDNFQNCSQIDERFITYIVKLTARTREPKCLEILQVRSE